MRTIPERKHFEPRARLLLQLGDKLIRNENIALLELIKNSYDADARRVKVILKNVETKNIGVIEVNDDGDGMDIDIIQNVWMEPGSDHKEILTRKNIRSKKYGRLPIGEKGIGRFGAHKLGHKIELISRQSNKLEVVVKIDWREFGKEKYLKDAKVEIFERTPVYFTRQKTGTKIIISDLKESWDSKMIKHLYKSIFSLNSPFDDKVGKFKVDLIVDDPRVLGNLPSWEEIRDFSLWHFKCKIKGTEIVEFAYSFKPWDEMSGIEEREVSLEDKYLQDRSSLTVKSIENKKKEIILNLSKDYGSTENPLHLGEIKFEGYIFDKDKTTLELYNASSTPLLKQYLNEQGGIRVYRDNIRINEYGEKGNDWLNLDSRRVNVPAKRVSNNNILAVVDLNQEDSTALIEKTNREGFINNEAFNDFTAALLYVLNIVEVLRKEDKDVIRAKYNPTEKQEPVLYNLSKLKQLVEDKVKVKPVKIEINKYLQKIEDDYNRINEILLSSAGVGLTMGVGIHEVEKVISELKLIVEKEDVPETILNLVVHLDEVIESYSDLFRQSEGGEEDIVKLINGSIFNIQYRLKAHSIELIKNYDEIEKSTINCNKRLLMGAIINVFDNSLYWLDRKEKKLSQLGELFTKKILIKLVEEGNSLLIIIADNGFGFGIPTSKISKPFISDKQEGMGLGLHIVSEVMKVQKGELLFPDNDTLNLPVEFKTGAVTVLKLNT